VTKSLAELESESTDFRTATDSAVAEVTRLQEHRKRLLLTASVDEILKIDGEIRRQEIAGEIADAKAFELRTPIYAARIEATRWAGVVMPTDSELDKLYEIVIATRPDLKLERETTRFEYERDHRDEFKRAFFAVGRLGRLTEPSPDRHFHAVVDDANRVLSAPPQRC
jgi:hypothetical protein